MPVLGGSTFQPGGLGNVWRGVKASYSFAVQGGAVSTINLLTSNDIPQGAIILGGLINVTTAVTSGGAATVAVQVEGAADILGATAPAGLTLGRKSIIPAFTGATSVQTTAPRGVSITIAVAALTAGAFDVYLIYVGP